MTPYREITDEQWHRVVTLFPELQPRLPSRGRPLTDTRAVLNGVLWVIYSGAAWSSMPRRYPSYQTCHRRFKIWYDSGVFRHVLAQLYGDAAETLCDSIKLRMRSTLGSRTLSVPAFSSVEAPALSYLASLRRAA
ncbi:transposase [Trinickia caryophylli]|uniref:Transposase n=1 Tax=Trinickia caryophylli TaxID=28094 RepID=A0A1X7G9L4_TRICW|nr:transposase [Trinickia caryophylli]TRX17587.1 transposase [Trinickia caryophylli]WQE11660.1 transposase [Trinickia caryophylli]GLU34845.1 transposase [Trinickia caryophylli]SMF66218.1 Transposase [Trinickia caryophylli]